MADRVPCLNPQCRCTIPADRHPDSTYVICRKCWKAMPALLRDRWKLLNKRSRLLGRMGKKSSFNRPERHQQWHRIAARYDRAWVALEASIRLYFREGTSPTGLDQFLKDIGFA